MKKNSLLFYLVFVLAATLAGCSDENSKSTSQNAIEKPKAQKYPTISAMIDSSGDFATDNGTFKILSEDPLHIQISEITMNGTADEQLKQETLKNIVYVAYQAFATTDINSLTITSIPLIFDSEKQKSMGYNDAFKRTLTIKRDKAKEVMEQFVGSTNFDELLGTDVENGTYLANSPSAKFDKLKSVDTIEGVVTALTK